MDILHQTLRGSCQVEKKSKNPRKTRIGQTAPTHPPLSIFFFGNMKKHKKLKKRQNFPQKNKNPSWGLTEPPTSEFFSDFWIFLT